jgi:hypothetical protein
MMKKAKMDIMIDLYLSDTTFKSHKFIYEVVGAESLLLLVMENLVEGVNEETNETVVDLYESHSTKSVCYCRIYFRLWSIVRILICKRCL